MYLYTYPKRCSGSLMDTGSQRCEIFSGVNLLKIYLELPPRLFKNHVDTQWYFFITCPNLSNSIDQASISRNILFSYQYRFIQISLHDCDGIAYLVKDLFALSITLGFPHNFKTSCSVSPIFVFSNAFSYEKIWYEHDVTYIAGISKNMIMNISLHIFLGNFCILNYNSTP